MSQRVRDYLKLLSRCLARRRQRELASSLEERLDELAGPLRGGRHSTPFSRPSAVWRFLMRLVSAALMAAGLLDTVCY